MNQDKLMDRVDIASHVMSFSEMASEACRTKKVDKAVIPEGASKKSKPLIVHTYKNIRPPKPSEMAGVRTIEKPVLTEVYGEHWAVADRIKASWNHALNNVDNEIAATLDCLAQELKRNYDNQWKVRDYLSRQLRRRRQSISMKEDKKATEALKRICELTSVNRYNTVAKYWCIKDLFCDMMRIRYRDPVSGRMITTSIARFDLFDENESARIESCVTKTLAQLRVAESIAPGEALPLISEVEGVKEILESYK
jgi:hypothetical protein